MKFNWLFLLFILLPTFCIAQTGVIRGQVVDQKDRSSLSFTNISVDDETVVLESDTTGSFELELPAGYHKLTFSYLGYETKVFHQVKVDPIKPTLLFIEMEPSASQLSEIAVTANALNKTAETPLSVRTIGINEITRLPGSTIDVSKVIKNLPGVLPKVSFGYNIIVRGGASHENKFFIDGIEIPSINHFSVQGVSGGPNGIINVDILRRANLITGAFPADRYNALSSVLNLQTRSGRSDRLGGKFTLGATDVGLTLEGPITKNSNFIASARKSFSEYYLKAFKLPVLPAYSDYNVKFEQRWKKSELKIIGIGGWDQSRLNLDDARAEDASVALRYNTGYIPEGDQSVHTSGANYKIFSGQGHTSIVASTSYFTNKAIKYFDNTFEEEDLWFDYNAEQRDHRLRIENQYNFGLNKLKLGASVEQTSYLLDNYSTETGPDLHPIILDFNSSLNTFQYGFFTSYSMKLLNNKLDIFGGLRMDASSYGSLTNNPLNQISPRAAISYQLTSKAKISASAGSYYQLPPSVMLAFSENEEISNTDRLGYINSNQVAAGYAYQWTEDKIISIEGFYKGYSNYPFLLRDSISFANANADYVAVGNQPANSSSEGRSYGLEFFVQKKFRKKSLWSATYNLSKSEFKDKDGQYVNSSWDTRHFLTLVYARTFGKNWQIGAKYTYASSSPYTPFDIERSSRIDYWEINRRGAFDFDRLNTSYLKPFQQLDFRIDKNYYKKNFTANLYLDIQNIYSAAIEFIPYLVPVSDENGDFVVDPSDPSRYQMSLIASDSGRVLPTIGIIIEL